MLRQLNAHKVWGLILAITLVATLSIPARESIFAQDAGALEDAMNAYMNSQLEDDISSYKFSNLKIKTDKDPNIYLVLYNELAIEAHNKVVESLQAQGYDNKAIGQIQSGVSAQGDLQEAYESELDFYSELVKHQNETLALEMFTNGSTRDGDFDLLDDLQKIEDILFARRQDGQLGPSISRSGGGGAVSTDFERPGINSNTDTDNNTDDEEESDTNEEETPVVIHEDGDICQLDEDLARELEEFIANNETDSSDDEGDDSDSSDGDRDTDVSPDSDRDRVLGSFIKRDSDCDEVFCFYTEEVRVTESAYFPDDNGCIACVLENMSETLEELNSQSVYPRKVTGNFLEPNMCKGSFGNMKFDLSVTLVERPIFSSDPVDSVTELSARSIVRDWRNQHSSSNRDEEAEEAVEAQLNLGSPSDLIDLSARSEEIQSQVDLERRIQEGLFPVSSSLDSEAGLIQELHQRMNTFTIYFDSYNQMLASMQSSLNTINSKPVCE